MNKKNTKPSSPLPTSSFGGVPLGGSLGKPSTAGGVFGAHPAMGPTSAPPGKSKGGSKPSVKPSAKQAGKSTGVPRRNAG